MKFGNSLNLETIDYIFRKIITLKEVNILESPKEYYLKQVLKNSLNKKPLSCFVFWGHWYPCFRFLVMYPLGFKARVYSRVAEVNVMYIP